MAQKALQEHGVLPTDFYNTSMSDFIKVQNAKPREERVQDPLTLARQAGLI